MKMPSGGLSPTAITDGIKFIIYFYAVLTSNVKMGRKGISSTQSPFIDSGLLADKLWLIYDWMSPGSEACRTWEGLANSDREALTAQLLIQASKLFNIFHLWSTHHSRDEPERFQIVEPLQNYALVDTRPDAFLLQAATASATSFR